MNPIKTYEDFVLRFNLNQFADYYSLTPGQIETLYQHLKKDAGNTVVGTKQLIKLCSPEASDVAPQIYLAVMAKTGVDELLLSWNALKVTMTPDSSSSGVVGSSGGGWGSNNNNNNNNNG